MRRLPLPLVLFAVLLAGLPALGQQPPVHYDFNVKACLLAGGRIQVYPLTGGAECNPATPDGGQSCRSGADCVSYCLADSLTCHPYQHLGAGCHPIIDRDGRRVTLCID